MEALNKTKGVNPRWLWRVECNSGGLQVLMSSAFSDNAETALGEVTASGLGGMVNGHAMLHRAFATKHSYRKE